MFIPSVDDLSMLPHEMVSPPNSRPPNSSNSRPSNSSNSRPPVSSRSNSNVPTKPMPTGLMVPSEIERHPGRHVGSAPAFVRLTQTVQTSHLIEMTGASDGSDWNDRFVPAEVKNSTPSTSDLAVADELFLDDHSNILGVNSMAMMTQAKQDSRDRPRWRSKTDYLLCCIGYAVGLGNLWRFPYLCYENGGGAFLVPHTLCTLFLGVPMFLIELGIGQQKQMGFIKVWRSINGKLSGLGLTSVCLAAVCAIYYNVIIAWSIYYLCHSFGSKLPWSYGGLDIADSAHKYWLESVLRKSEGMEFLNLSHTNLGLLLCLTVAWVIVFVSVSKRSAISDAVIFSSTVLPYVGLLILFCRGVTLPGAVDGIRYFFAPKWEKLWDMHVWAVAGSQLFYSLGIGWGSLVNYASFNPRRNNFFHDAYLVVAANYFTSIFAGVVVFAVVGYMSDLTGVSVDQVARAGSGLVFVVYPAGLATLPIAQFFSVVFFLVLICLGISSQFAMVEVIITAMVEASLFKRVAKEKLVGVLCLGFWIIGIAFITPAGSYFVDLLDAFVGSVALYVVALLEVFGIIVWYGLDRFSDDCFEMTGRRLSRSMRLMIKFGLPVCLISIILSAVASFALAQTTATHVTRVARGSFLGLGCVSNCTSVENGRCNEDFNLCECMPSWEGPSCGTFVNSTDYIGCPELCAGRGECDNTNGHCHCFSGFEGPSCRGDKYSRSWPLWADVFGWVLACGSLVPIPLVMASRTVRKKLKQGIDEVPILSDHSFVDT